MIQVFFGQFCTQQQFEEVVAASAVEADAACREGA